LNIKKGKTLNENDTSEKFQIK